MNSARIQKRRKMLTLTDASMFLLYFVLWLAGTGAELITLLLTGHVLTRRYPLRFAEAADGYGYRKLLARYVHSGPICRDDNEKLSENIPYYLLNRKIFPKEMLTRLAGETMIFIALVVAFVLLADVSAYHIHLLIKAFVIFEMRNMVYWFLQGRYDHFYFTSNASLRTYLQYRLSVDSFHTSSYLEKAKDCGWLRKL